MKQFTLFLLLSLVVQAGFCGNKKSEIPASGIIVNGQDSAILTNFIERFSGERNKPTGELVSAIGKAFLGTPYVAHTLENGKDENLVVNLRELDCTTFAENCLALALTIKSEHPEAGEFTGTLERIRYRDGKRDGYLSRLHYFSDWIYNNEQKGLVTQPANDFGSPFDVKVSFMSAHPDSYEVLKENPELVTLMAGIEKTVSDRKYYFLKKEDIERNEDKLQEGDIVGIATSVPGLDITHVGILVRKDGRIHLMHASSSLGKVVISDVPLAEMLMNKKSYTGIMIARPR